MKKIISIFLLIVLTTNIGLAQMNISPNSESNEIIKEEVQNLIDTYQEDINKIIKKEKDKISYKKNLKKFELGYPNDNDVRWDYSSPYAGRVTFPLCDGDYAVWNSKLFDKEGLFGWWTWKGRKSVQYAGEYHKDGSFMGIVKMKRINKKVFAFYEYRVNKISDDEAFLKHVMVYYNKKDPVTFITDSNGDIRGILYKEQMFSTNLDNIVNIGELDMSSLSNPNLLNDTLNIAAYGIGTVVGAAGAIAAIPLGLVAWPVLMILMIQAEENQKDYRY